MAGFFENFTGGHGILGRRGLKQERELTDVMLDQIGTNDELGTELAPLLQSGRAPMTVEQHRAYRQMIAGRVNDLQTVNEGVAGFRSAQSHLRSQAATPENVAQLDVMDTQADYAHRLLISNNPKLQEAGTQLMAKVLQAQQDFSTTNEAQKLAQDSQRDQLDQQLGQRHAQSFLNLQDNFRNESAPFLAQRQAFGTLQSALQNPSPTGDMALIFSYMKILDPGSVVREGEFATAQNLSGVPDILRTTYNRLLREGERLTPAERKDFYTQAVESFKTAREGQIERNTRYLGQARDVGLPENMLGHFTLPLEALGSPVSSFGADQNAPAPANPALAGPSQTDSTARMVGTSLRDSIGDRVSDVGDFAAGLADFRMPNVGVRLVDPRAAILKRQQQRAAARAAEEQANAYPRGGTIQREVNE